MIEPIVKRNLHMCIRVCACGHVHGVDWVVGLEEYCDRTDREEEPAHVHTCARVCAVCMCSRAHVHTCARVRLACAAVHMCIRARVCGRAADLSPEEEVDPTCTCPHAHAHMHMPTYERKR